MAWLDIWGWVDAALTKDLPDVRVIPETDIDPPTTPSLVWSCTAAFDQYWEASLTLVLLCTPDKAEHLLNKITDVVQSWQTPGPLHSVELTGLRGARATAQLGGKPVREFTLHYTIQWP